jgi:hypothetical protein
VIAGNVNGSITAGNRLELQSSCFVSGSIATKPKHLKLEEGARFRGHVQMLEDGAESSSADGHSEAFGPESAKLPRVALAAKPTLPAALSGTNAVRPVQGNPADSTPHDILLQIGR